MPRMLRRQEGADDARTTAHTDPEQRGRTWYTDGLLVDGKDEFAEMRRVSRDRQAADLAAQEAIGMVDITRSCGHITMAPHYLNEHARAVYRRTPCKLCALEALTAQQRQEQAIIADRDAVATG